MIAYASRTGTHRNLAALRLVGWRLLISAMGVHRHEGFQYALDNGAWTAWTHGHQFNVAAFEKMMAKLADKADWCALPDIVCGGAPSLDLSLSWMDRVLGACRMALLPVQPGMTIAAVEPYISSRVGVFVGGSSEWKLATMADWAALAARKGAWCHVARVNSARRILQCSRAGAHSFDGSSASRFAVTTPGLARATAQLGLFTGRLPT